MSKISLLRERADKTRDLTEQKIQRVKNAVNAVVKSDAFVLSAVNNMQNTTSEENLENFAQTVADRVAAEVINPVNEFMDVCKARGVPERKIMKIVLAINDLFNLTDESEYEKQLEATALYMQKNPKLYDDIAMFG